MTEKGSDEKVGFEGSNGEREYGLAAVDSYYQKAQSERRIYDRETADRKAEHNEKIRKAQEDRSEAMFKASFHAGNIGMIYYADSNTFSRIVIVDSLPSIPVRPGFSFPAGEIGVGGPDRRSNAGQDSDVIDLEYVEEQKGKAPQESETDQTGEEPPLRRPSFPQKPERPPMPDHDVKWNALINVKSGFAWFFAALVGAFVGFGLLTIIGLPYQRPGDRVNLVTTVAIGIAAICGMKLLLDAMWYKAGRERELMDSSPLRLAIYSTISFLIVAVEASLGGYALVKYSEKASFQGAGKMDLWLAIFLAIAVSTSTLLFSAFIGYQKGQRSVSDRDRAEADYQHSLRDHAEKCKVIEDEYQEQVKLVNERRQAEREIENRRHRLHLEMLDDSKQAHAEMLERWKTDVEMISKHHHEGMMNRDQRNGELETLQKLPDYRALLQCIGLVSALTVRIDELTKQRNDENISRGYGRKNNL
jgi:hypothetical protein